MVMGDVSHKLLDERISATFNKMNLQSGGTPPYPPDMEARLTRIEVESEHLRRDIGEVKTDLKTIIARLGHMPTTGGLWGMVATVIGVSVAMVALFIGILTYLQALH